MKNKILNHFLQNPVRYIIIFIFIIGFISFMGKLNTKPDEMYSDNYDYNNHMKYIIHIIHNKSDAKVPYEFECERYERKNGLFVLYDKNDNVIHSEDDDMDHDFTIYKYDEAPAYD